MSDISNIYLWDVSRKASVEATLHDGIAQEDLEQWASLWLPAMRRAVEALKQNGVPPSRWPQDAHWRWDSKVLAMQGLLAGKTFTVRVSEQTQGLMSVKVVGNARIPEQLTKPLVYVDFLQIAPWNRPELVAQKRFSGIGTALIIAANELSREEGFKGRIGLHSLPQADAFYRKCGMTDLGPDAAYQNLRYFEMTPKQVDQFLEGERK